MINIYYTVRDDEVIDGDKTFNLLTYMLKYIVEQRSSINFKKSH